MDTATSIPAHVVEDHDEALPLIYRAIGAKRLPLKTIGLVHFDAHPDLLSPNIQAEECCDKEKLFAYTSIAEWILPAVYMGHLGCVIWLKPSWCTQIPEGAHQLVVGKDKATGYIRVGTPFSYFISELLYVPEEALENVRTIPLHVVTVQPPGEEPLGNNTDCSTNTGGRLVPSQEDVGRRSVPSQEDVGGRSVPSQEDVGGRSVPSQEDVGRRSVPSQEDAGGRSVPSQEDVGEHLPSHSCSSLHVDSCLPTNVTIANKVIEREGKEKEEEEEKEEKEDEEKKGEKEEKEGEKKEEREEEVAVEKREKEYSKKHSNTHLEATCELSPPAKRPRIQQSMCSQPLADDVEGEGFKETSPTGTNVPEDCVHNKEDFGAHNKEDFCAILLTVLRQCSAWVLDVDLDFFSTSNPFKSLFTEEQYHFMKKLYALAEPEDPGYAESLEECVEKRWFQLNSLQKMWATSSSESLSCSSSSDIPTDPSSDSSSDPLTNLLDDTDNSALLKQIQSLVGTFHDDADGAVVTAEYLHIAGMMTDLPCHVSGEEEIRGLAAAMKELMWCCATCKVVPSMITIARSTEDDYTPQSQVEIIQDLVIDTLQDVYGSLNIHYHHLKTHQEAIHS